MTPLETIPPTLASRYLRLISSPPRSLLDNAGQSLLGAASLCYHTGWRIQEAWRRWGRAATPCRVGLPVISLGNLAWGGTGKTPFALHLARELLARGRRPALLSRGYAAAPGALNDETLMIRQLAPGIPSYCGKDRVALARRVEQERRADLLILDDGFSHRRLHRDLDLVLHPALPAPEEEHLLPRGRLREPWSALARAHWLFLTHTVLCPEGEISRRREFFLRVAPHLRLGTASYRLSALLRWNGESTQPENFPPATRWLAFCALGSPDLLQEYLRLWGLECAGLLTFRDHHLYSPEDLHHLEQVARSRGATALLTTRKDAVKIPPSCLPTLPLGVLETTWEIGEGRGELLDQLERLGEP